jgi:hypothetical protein
LKKNKQLDEECACFSILAENISPDYGRTYCCFWVKLLKKRENQRDSILIKI